MTSLYEEWCSQAPYWESLGVGNSVDLTKEEFTSLCDVVKAAARLIEAQRQLEELGEIHLTLVDAGLLSEEEAEESKETQTDVYLAFEGCLYDAVKRVISLRSGRLTAPPGIEPRTET